MPKKIYIYKFVEINFREKNKKISWLSMISLERQLFSFKKFT